MFKAIVCGSFIVAMAGCQAERCREAHEPTVVQVLPEGVGMPGLAHAGARTITVGGAAEILTAPDRFEISAGFEVQTLNLDDARDESKRRAAALLAVAERHGVAACDVQTHQLSLQPRYDNNYGEHRKLIGYEASRSLTLTVHDIEEVEAVLYDLAAAGANRIDRVEFSTSALTDKRAEARVLAVEAAHEKAAAMAAALGQTIGEPLRIDEGGEPSWSPYGAANINNFSYSNETVAQVTQTVAAGKIQVRAAVSVTFKLQG